MQIEFIHRSPEEVERCEYRDAFVVRVNDRDFMQFFDGEPEDNSLARNFSDVRRIKSLVEKVEEAIADGELIAITERNSDDI